MERFHFGDDTNEDNIQFKILPVNVQNLIKMEVLFFSNTTHCYLHTSQKHIYDVADIVVNHKNVSKTAKITDLLCTNFQIIELTYQNKSKKLLKTIKLILNSEYRPLTYTIVIHTSFTLF